MSLGVSLIFHGGGVQMGITVTSAAFGDGDRIPAKFTCDGENVSPPLAWTGVPESSETLTLICDDPDSPSGTWVHWVLFNLPATATELAEGVRPEKQLTSGARQGRNDFKKIGYGGPCPHGGTHRYYFKLYALDTALSLPPGVTKDELLKAMQGHILAEGQLMGKYRR
jgi:Raf kinase inhibitor-like YbhB/YbcL family protein